MESESTNVAQAAAEKAKAIKARKANPKTKPATKAASSKTSGKKAPKAKREKNAAPREALVLLVDRTTKDKLRAAAKADSKSLAGWVNDLLAKKLA